MSPSPAMQTFRMLLIDDNEADVYLLRRALQQAGLAVELTVLKDGAEGLAFARSEDASSLQPDLVVLDLNLPKSGGAEVLRAMKGNPVLASVPVVVMSSSASKAEQAAIAALGATKYLTKPPDLAGFMKVGKMFREVLLREI